MGKRVAVVVDGQAVAAWRSRLARYAAGTQNVAAFCHGEAVSTWSFYKWRTREHDHVARCRSVAF